MITLTVEMMEAFLKKSNDIETIIPYSVAPEYPLEVYKQFFEYKIDRFRKFPSENDWEGVIIQKEDNIIMGDMGFKGGPDIEGNIDIGYSIVPSYQGKGYATEMGKAMVDWGLSQPSVKKVIATCDLDNYASIRVLEKIGFKVSNKTESKYHWIF